MKEESDEAMLRVSELGLGEKTKKIGWDGRQATAHRRARIGQLQPLHHLPSPTKRTPSLSIQGDEDALSRRPGKVFYGPLTGGKYLTWGSMIICVTFKRGRRRH